MSSKFPHLAAEGPHFALPDHRQRPAKMAAQIQQLGAATQEFVEKNKKAVAIGAGVTAAGLVAAYAWRRAANYVPTTGPYPPSSLPAGAYDGEWGAPAEPRAHEAMREASSAQCSLTNRRRVTDSCSLSRRAPLARAAVVVGAGPSGSVCSYFLAKGGAKVALLEKETFPRDKCVLARTSPSSPTRAQVVGAHISRSPP